MQDSWCGDDMPLTGSRQTSWEEEEDVEIGMWNSSSSQEANTSLNWPPYMKKMPTKVIVTCGDLTSHTGASWQWKGKKKVMRLLRIIPSYCVKRFPQKVVSGFLHCCYF